MEIRFTTTPIKDIDSALHDFLTKENLPFKLNISKLKSDLEHYLVDNIHAYIEFPYVDKVYRDSYYVYFSTKRKNYLRDCIRIALFKKPISNDMFFDKTKHNHLRKSGNFLGFIIIRPSKKMYGRTVLSPLALRKNDLYICLAKYKVMINGIEFEVLGFPHQSQDGESMRCAEVTIWSTMEYFGNKYAEYKPILPSDIINILKKISYERQTPSKGLLVTQISYALKKLGLGTKIYSEKGYNPHFNAILNSYVDSGIPVITNISFSSAHQGHTYLIIGHEEIQDKEIEDVLPQEEIATRVGKINIIDSSLIKKRYVTIDDNYYPYQLTTLDDPCSYYYKDEKGNPKYNLSNENAQRLNAQYSSAHIDSIIIPLYKKVYLDAFFARELFLAILSTDVPILIEENIGYNHSEKEVILRFFLTSSRSFKKQVAEEVTLDSLSTDMRSKIVLTPMPKFIFVCELTCKKLLKGKHKRAFGMIVLDATEASKNHLDALMFIVYPDRLHFKDVNDRISVESGVITTPFKMYNNNLQ